MPTSITTINGTDVISTSRTDINNNFSSLNTNKIETSYLDTDTTLAANSDSKIATQKATKAYVDANLAQNASTTAKGIVEEATQAEVTSGTATGATGARLFVNPANAIASTTNVGMVEEATQAEVDAGTAAGASARLFINPSTQRVPFYQQSLVLSVADSLASNEFCSTAMSDGSAFFVRIQGGAKLYRFAKDSLTGNYSESHSITPTLSIPTGDTGALVVIGSYLYMVSNDGTNVKISRFLAADLTGEQVMTVPTLGCTNFLNAWTDGTFLWLVSDSAGDTVSYKWSVSGTTFSNTGVTGTVTTNIFERPEGGNVYDGTTTYVYNFSSPTMTIEKLSNIDGSSRTESTKTFTLLSDSIAGSFMIPIDTARYYIGTCVPNYDETGVIGTIIKLFPVTKP